MIGRINGVEGGDRDEVEQIIEPTIRIVVRPTVQLGLDLQYPLLGLQPAQQWLTRIHRRPPGIPALPLRTCWLPSPCDRLSRPSDYYGASAPTGAISRRCACPSAALAARQRGRHRTVPTFISKSIDERGVQLYPCGIATVTPQIFTVASWPVVTSTRSSPPPPRGVGYTATSPYPPDLSWWAVKGASNTDFSRTPSRLADRTRIVWQYRHIPALSGLLPPSPASPGSDYWWLFARHGLALANRWG